MQIDELTFKAKDIMRQLEAQMGQTIGLGVLESETGNGIVLATVKGTAGFAYQIQVGYQFPLHTAAPGKAILAYLPQDERAAVLDRMDFQKFTPSTICDRSDFEAELESVFLKGYAIDVSEQLEGCHCIGVPIFDSSRRVIAGLWVTGPSSQLPVRSFSQIADQLKKSAQEITLRLSSTARSTNRDYIRSAVEQAREAMQNNLHQPMDMQKLALRRFSWSRWR